MSVVATSLEPSGDVTFLSDDERRYGNTLFEICARVVRDGQRGRPPKVLPEGVKIWLKNKGCQSSELGANVLSIKPLTENTPTR